MATIGELRGQIQKIYAQVVSPLQTATNLGKIDPRFLDPTIFKKNDMGFPVKNWLRLSNQDVGGEKDILNRTKLYGKDILTEADRLGDLELVDNRFIDVLLFNVIIDVNTTPTVVMNQVKGLSGGSVKQYFNSDDYSITVRGTLSGPLPWQTDTFAIQNLNTLASIGDSLYLQNPDLNKIWGIDQVAVTGVAINDNPSFQSLKNFTISLVSDTAIDIFKVKAR